MAEQTLAEALQEVYQTVNTELGTQDGSVTFQTRTVVENNTFGLPDTSTTNNDVSIATGLKISKVKTRELDPGGKVQVDDLKIEVPANLLAEAQLKDSDILYNGKTYTLITYSPLEILSSVPVRWQVIVREKS